MPGPSETSVELTVRITVPSDLAAFLQTGDPHIADLAEVLTLIGSELVRRRAGSPVAADGSAVSDGAMAADEVLRTIEARR